MRDTQLQKMEENKEFMEECNQENHKNWKQNRKRQKDLKVRELHFQDLEVKAYKDKLNKELDHATRDMGGGLVDYEKNL